MRGVRFSVGAAALTLAFVSGTGVAEASFSAHGSVEQVYVTDLAPGAQMSLLNRPGRKVATKRADAQGGLVFREVRPGIGYRVRLSPKGAKSGPLTVLSTRSAPPSTDVYNQTIPSSGYGYLTTRDGTKLSIYVHPPQDVANAAGTGVPLPQVPAGPTPTLIEYGGYGYADPAGPQSGIAILGNLMGITVVDVNMRGTGCSGGSFDFFEPLQSLDGYDVIEAVARQPWVKYNKVGMMGISYGGISQLFTAQTNPPAPGRDHTALADRRHPDDALSRAASSTPASRWSGPRSASTTPSRLAPRTGQPWAYKRIQEGDQTCKANQALHGQAVDLMAQDPGQQPLHAQGGRSGVAGHVREQDQGADLHGLPVDGRADRRALPDAGLAPHGHEPQVDHVHQRHPCRLAGPGDGQPLVRLPRALRRPGGADHQRRDRQGRGSGDLPGSDGDLGRDDAPPIRSRSSRPTRARSRRSRSSSRSGSCSTTARAARRRASRCPPSSSPSPSFPIPGTTARSWYLGSRRRPHATRSRLAREPTRSRGTPRPAR